MPRVVAEVEVVEINITRVPRDQVIIYVDPKAAPDDGSTYEVTG